MHDASILWQASLSDIQLRHDLDSADDRGGRLGRRRLDFLQYAVNTVTDFETVLERLYVDIGCASFHRPLHDQVDQTNDRSLGRQVTQMLDILQVAFVFPTEALDDLPHGAASTAEQFLDAIFNLRSDSHLRYDFFTAGHGQRLAGESITRIGHHHGQVAVGFGNGQNEILFQVAN